MLDARPEARELLNWLLSSSPWDGMTGRPSGPPQWPLGRGLLETRADLVGYANLFRSEWGYIVSASQKLKPTAESGPKPPRRKRR